MPRKSTQNTKKKIVSAAWKLFYEQGYDNTTIDDIVSESGTSKGSFYHYFKSKDDLLSSLSYVFDDKYEELQQTLGGMSCTEKLLYLNKELFKMIENSISIDLLAKLLSSQLITTHEKSLLDHNRMYFKLLRAIIIEGQISGEIPESRSVSEVVKAYTLFERALMYDWCLNGGEYSLSDYSGKILPVFLRGFLE